MSDNNASGCGGQTPRPGPDHPRQGGGAVPRSAHVRGPGVLSNRDDQEINTRRRVAVVVAALVATLGAVLGVNLSGLSTFAARGRVSVPDSSVPLMCAQSGDGGSAERR